MNVAEMKKLLRTVQSQLALAPQGNLWTSKSHNCFQYYNGEGGKKYISRNEAKLLAQKKYLEQLEKELTKQIKLLDFFQERYDETSLEKVFDNLPECVRVLVTPLVKTYKQFGTEWTKKDYRPKLIKPGTKTYKTENGEYVRSKSEVIIANILKSMGLYYRYECPKQIKDFGVLYPDFTVLNPKDRKEVLIEHFGMMNNPEYVEIFMKKLKTYDLAGIYPGQGLICFFETSDCPLDIEYVERMLKTYFTLS